MAEQDDNNEVVDLDFLDTSAKEAGYDETKEPGKGGVTPPEGKYRLRYELSPQSDPNAKWWTARKTKPNKKGEVTKYAGGSIKGKLLMPAPGEKLSLEDFDQLGLFGRQFSSFLSSMFMYGRCSLTDWLNSVLPEKVNPSTSIGAMLEMVEEVMMQSPEGIASLIWTPYFVTEEDGKTKYERLAQLNDAMKTKYKGGTKSKHWPKDPEDGSLLTNWKENLSDPGTPEDEQEIVDVVVFAEVKDFFPTEAEQEG
jgi:hypothetical protein